PRQRIVAQTSGTVVDRPRRRGSEDRAAGGVEPRHNSRRGRRAGPQAHDTGRTAFRRTSPPGETMAGGTRKPKVHDPRKSPNGTGTARGRGAAAADRGGTEITGSTAANQILGRKLESRRPRRSPAPRPAGDPSARIRQRPRMPEAPGRAGSRRA